MTAASPVWKTAGTISADLFVGHFARRLPWVHPDIAGLAFDGQAESAPRPQHSATAGVLRQDILSIPAVSPPRFSTERELALATQPPVTWPGRNGYTTASESPFRCRSVPWNSEHRVLGTRNLRPVLTIIATALMTNSPVPFHPFSAQHVPTAPLRTDEAMRWRSGPLSPSWWSAVPPAASGTRTTGPQTVDGEGPMLPTQTSSRRHQRARRSRDRQWFLLRSSGWPPTGSETSPN